HWILLSANTISTHIPYPAPFRSQKQEKTDTDKKNTDKKLNHCLERHFDENDLQKNNNNSNREDGGSDFFKRISYIFHRESVPISVFLLLFPPETAVNFCFINKKRTMPTLLEWPCSFSINVILVIS